MACRVDASDAKPVMRWDMFSRRDRAAGATLTARAGGAGGRTRFRSFVPDVDEGASTRSARSIACTSCPPWLPARARLRAQRRARAPPSRRSAGACGRAHALTRSARGRVRALSTALAAATAAECCRQQSQHFSAIWCCFVVQMRRTPSRWRADERGRPSERRRGLRFSRAGQPTAARAGYERSTVPYRPPRADSLPP